VLGSLYGPEDGVDMFSEMSADFKRTALRYISEDKTLHNHRWENNSLFIYVITQHLKLQFKSEHKKREKIEQTHVHKQKM
jgi:hypothetical protein